MGVEHESKWARTLSNLVRFQIELGLVVYQVGLRLGSGWARTDHTVQGWRNRRILMILVVNTTQP